MTTSAYITKITYGLLSLVNETVVLADQNNLGTDEYFVLMFYTTYQSYLRNYKEYRGYSNYNTVKISYDLDINKQLNDSGYGFYISKYYNKIKSEKGRVLIVDIPDITECIDLDS